MKLMQVTETSAEGLKREFTVVVPAGDIETQTVSRLNEIGHSVKVPGFRPGKVPIGLLKSRYGDAVRGEILEQTVQSSWQEAMTEKGLRPALEPKIEIVKFEDGGDLEYKMAVELLPDIEPVDFSAIELERLVTKATDEEIDAALARMAEQQTTFEPVKDGRAAADGDQVVLDFTGKVDGEEFAGGSVNDFILQLGSDGFLAGFEEQLVGAAGGTSREFKVEVADDHPSEALRGKEVVFQVDVKEVREAQTVAVDDAMAEAAGLENLEALKKTVRDQIEREYAQFSRARLKRALLDQLADGHVFEVPSGIIEREFDSIWTQISEARENDRLDEDDKDKSEDELRDRYRGIAERRVRLGLLLSEVGRTNNITVSQDDLNRAMQQEAARHPGQEAQVIEFFQKNPEAKQEIEAPLFEEKVVDFMVEMAKVTEREVTLAELLREVGEETSEAAETSEP
jgi:trigger factor